MEDRLKYLESLLPCKEDVLEKKHFKKFEKQAGYVGNGVYGWCGNYATDTRELWLMGVLTIENVEFEEE